MSRLWFEPRPFCAWVQHANHSATEPPHQCVPTKMTPWASLSLQTKRHIKWPSRFSRDRARELWPIDIQTNRPTAILHVQCTAATNYWLTTNYDAAWKQNITYLLLDPLVHMERQETPFILFSKVRMLIQNREKSSSTLHQNYLQWHK